MSTEYPWGDVRLFHSLPERLPEITDQDGTVLISVGRAVEPPLVDGGQGRSADELLDVRACIAAGCVLVSLALALGALSLVLWPPHAGALSLDVVHAPIVGH